ncbi:MAG: hypothetical protein QXT26_02430 [Thermoproteota archaeon]
MKSRANKGLQPQLELDMSEEAYVCEACGRRFANKRALSSHVHYKHGSRGERPWTSSPTSNLYLGTLGYDRGPRR